MTLCTVPECTRSNVCGDGGEREENRFVTLTWNSTLRMYDASATTFAALCATAAADTTTAVVTRTVP